MIMFLNCLTCFNFLFELDFVKSKKLQQNGEKDEITLIPSLIDNPQYLCDPF